MLSRPTGQLSENKPKNRQSAETRLLAKNLRKSYRVLRSWRMVARHHKITTPAGAPNPGLTKQIALDGYEPHTNECRQRIGLKLHRGKTIDEHLSGDRIADMPAPLLTYAITHREEI